MTAEPATFGSRRWRTLRLDDGYVRRKRRAGSDVRGGLGLRHVRGQWRELASAVVPRRSSIVGWSRWRRDAI
jgi:hypothetical protein